MIRRRTAAALLLLAVVIVAAAWGPLARFVAEDRCLDSGGAWRTDSCVH